MGLPLAAGAIAAALAFFVGVVTDVHALRLATKPWPVVLLGLWVWRAAPVGPYRRWMVAGLGASLAGDMFLEVSPRGFFIPGLLSFLVAHVFYVLAYLADTRAPAPLRALPAYAFGVTLVAALSAGAARPARGARGGLRARHLRDGLARRSAHRSRTGRERAPRARGRDRLHRERLAHRGGSLRGASRRRGAPHEQRVAARDHDHVLGWAVADRGLGDDTRAGCRESRSDARAD